MGRRQVFIQRTRNGGLGMPDLESHLLAERLAWLGRSLKGDAVWRQKANRTFCRVTPSGLELQSGPGRHARLRSLWQWSRING